MGYDIIPVVIGILIALFIDNIRENFKACRLTYTTFESLAREFRKKTTELEQTVIKREAFLDSLGRHLENDSIPMFVITRKAGGFQTPDPARTNWQAALNNNSLSMLDFETVSLLSRIDVQHDVIQRRTEDLQKLMYQPALFEKGTQLKTHKLTFQVFFADYLQSERKLLSLCRNTIRCLKRTDFINYPADDCPFHQTIPLPLQLN